MQQVDAAQLVVLRRGVDRQIRLAAHDVADRSIARFRLGQHAARGWLRKVLRKRLGRVIALVVRQQVRAVTGCRQTPPAGWRRRPARASPLSVSAYKASGGKNQTHLSQDTCGHDLDASGSNASQLFASHAASGFVAMTIAAVPTRLGSHDSDCIGDQCRRVRRDVMKQGAQVASRPGRRASRPRRAKVEHRRSGERHERRRCCRAVAPSRARPRRFVPRRVAVHRGDRAASKTEQGQTQVVTCRAKAPRRTTRQVCRRMPGCRQTCRRTCEPLRNRTIVSRCAETARRTQSWRGGRVLDAACRARLLKSRAGLRGERRQRARAACRRVLRRASPTFRTRT